MKDILVGLAFVLAACGRADMPHAVTVPPQPSAPPASSAAISPAPAQPKSKMRVDVAGREIVVGLVADKPKFMAGDPVFLTLTWSAPQPIDVELSWMGENERRQNTSLKVVFEDSRGPLPVRPSGPSFGGQTWVEKLTPDHASTERILVASWVDKLPPGKVVARLETDVKARSDEKAAWQPVHVALELPLEILPDDATAMGGVIDAIGARLVGGDPEESRYAAMQLEALDDRRTIPYWIELAAKPSYEPKYLAVTALSKYRDTRSLATIVRIAKTRAEDLSREEYTTDELRKGSAVQVRIAAVHALFFLDARDELLAIAKDDPDPKVRNEARQFMPEKRPLH